MTTNGNEEVSDKALMIGGGFFGVLLLGILVLLMLWTPLLGPWVEARKGLAEFRRAEHNRQIKIEEARAKEAAAEFHASAEIIKAEGVAKANAIMSESLGGPEGYLRWKYIEMLSDTGLDSNTIIYVPTEANIPIMEAGRVSGRE